MKYISLICLSFIFMSSCKQLESTIENYASQEVLLKRSVPTTLYVGVEHELQLENSNGEEFTIKNNSSSTAGVNIIDASGTPYRVSPTRPGELTFDVINSNDDLVGSFQFQVKRIPNPIARLGNSSGGNISNGEFRAQGGVGAFLDDFDYDARCDVIGFEIAYIRSRMAPVKTMNAGARFTPDSRRLIGQARPGDIYAFNNIRVRCPGDVSSRQINSLVYFIK
ncbi:GldM family protein [Rhodohalobacter sp. 8-1]|uniref:GldM family protein n=1 Tax=Rhodohalobacter sp. 8-1 TaxID=3131972 RepID=UPI0030EC3B84